MSTVLIPERHAPSEGGEVFQPQPLTIEDATVVAIAQVASNFLRQEVRAPRSTHWIDEGECTKSDANAFHPVKESISNTKEPKSVCKPCPVRGACLIEALKDKDTRGVWGGSNYRDRNKMQKAIKARTLWLLSQAS